VRVFCEEREVVEPGEKKLTRNRRGIPAENGTGKRALFRHWETRAKKKVGKRGKKRGKGNKKRVHDQ